MLLLDRVGLRSDMGALTDEIHAQLYPYMSFENVVEYYMILERRGHVVIDRTADLHNAWQVRATVKGWVHHVANGCLNAWPYGR